MQQDVSGTVRANVDARCVHEVSQRLARDGDPHEQSREHVERQLSPDHFSHGCGLRPRCVDHDIGVNLSVIQSQHHSFVLHLDPAHRIPEMFMCAVADGSFHERSRQSRSIDPGFFREVCDPDLR